MNYNYYQLHKVKYFNEVFMYRFMYVSSNYVRIYALSRTLKLLKNSAYTFLI